MLAKISLLLLWIFPAVRHDILVEAPTTRFYISNPPSILLVTKAIVSLPFVVEQELHRLEACLHC